MQHIKLCEAFSFIEADSEVTGIILVVTEDMTEAWAISHKGGMIKIGANTLSEANLEVIVIQEGHKQWQIIMEIEVTADNQDSEANLNAPPEDLEMH